MEPEFRLVLSTVHSVHRSDHARDQSQITPKSLGISPVRVMRRKPQKALHF